MGAGASTQNGATGGAATSTSLDHYQILQIGETATQDEIKKAFRKVALKEHPDKNPHDIEGATKRFARVQAAYECLSDPQERAWYDDHRDDINNGGAAGGGGTTEAEASYFDAVRRGTQKPRARATPARGLQTPHLMKFFSTSAWSAFDDSPTGFFNTFATLFSLLAADETSWSSPHLYPSFGTSTTTDQADLRAFYQAWTNFSTEKDFAWKDLYKVEEEMPRWQRREIEKENQRARQTARREYNDAVRNLVLFVRRRDPRYTNSSSSAARAAAEAELRASLAAAARQRALEREAAASSYRAQDWEQADDKAEAVHAMWDEVSDEEDAAGEGEDGDGELIEEIVWCEACSKGYRSGGAWENHERSRKHGKNVERLIKEMQLEDEELGLGGASNARTPESDEDDLEPVASTSRSPSPDPASPGSRPRATAAEAAALADSLADLDLSQPATGEAALDFDDAPIPKRSKKKQRKKAQIVPGFDDDEDFEGGSGGTATPELPRGDDVDLDDVVGMAPSGGRRRKKGKGRQADFFADLDGSGAGQDDDEAVEVPVPLGLGRSGVGLDSSDEDRPSLRNARGKKKGRKAKQTPLAESRTPTTGDEARVETAPADTARGDLEQVDEPSALGDKELSKKEKRRLKEAAKKAGPGDDFVCNVCSESFPSRSKLFQHIDVTGHALAESAAAAGSGGKGGGRKKGGKR
ncbi:hypothetical protein BMF94_2030 [Rhodotorula taiwanensis]|uniref:J domain-containing protein n=1 Tax=Rhodotorula taiwanensis TaxID=741276 RepID=A0A2S5BE58_9BASI|nr:hypothetical protein BMF94_2030 [Rhodotorula taiwanensis]